MTIKRNSFSVMVIMAALIFMAPVSWSLNSQSSNSQCTVTSSSDWKNTVDFPYDSFMNYGTANWIKFTILLCDPERFIFRTAKNTSSTMSLQKSGSILFWV